MLQLLGTSYSCYNNKCITKLWSPALTFSIYTYFSWHFFHTVLFNSFQCSFHSYKLKFIILNSYEHLKFIESNPCINTFRIHFIEALLYHITPLVQVFWQFSSHTISYSILGLNLSSLTFLVPISNNCRSPLYHTILCKLQSLPFLTKWIIPEMYLMF